MTTKIENERRKAKRRYRARLALAGTFAAAVHALVLLGSHAPGAASAAGSQSAMPQEITDAFLAAPEPEEAPPQPAEEETTDPSADRANDAPSAASLPEPISTMVVSDITQVIQPSAAVMPRLDAPRWSVPASQMRSQHQLPTEGVFDLKDLDRRPQLVSQIQPVYPVELENSGTTGLVVVHFVVDARGRVQDLEVLSSPHQLLSTAVFRAVSRWEFRAGMKNGRTVATAMELPIRFNMN